MTVQVVELAGATPQPWRNGGGVTRELLAWPLGSGAAWQARVSVADIERDGPFSAYPGVQRCFAVLEGSGVVLRFAHAEHRLTTDTNPLAFDGAEAPDCTLLSGPTRDLNLMVRNDAGLARMERVRHGDPASPLAGSARRAWWGVFTTVAGRLLADDLALAVPDQSLAWWPGDVPFRFEFDTPAADARAWWLGMEAP